MPVYLGGNQEGGYRSGTVNIEGAIILSETIDHVYRNFDQSFNKVKFLNTLLIENLKSFGVKSERLVPETHASPFILSLKIKNTNARALVNRLSESGICISTQSACSSTSPKPSRILTSMGLDATTADTVIRVSFCPFNLEEEVVFLSQRIKALVHEK